MNTQNEVRMSPGCFGSTIMLVTALIFLTMVSQAQPSPQKVEQKTDTVKIKLDAQTESQMTIMSQQSLILEQNKKIMELEFEKNNNEITKLKEANEKFFEELLRVNKLDKATLLKVDKAPGELIVVRKRN